MYTYCFYLSIYITLQIISYGTTLPFFERKKLLLIATRMSGVTNTNLFVTPKALNCMIFTRKCKSTNNIYKGKMKI